MNRHLVILTALAAGCFGAEPEKLTVLADRIAKLAERESIESGIDTRLRAAELLLPVEPEIGKTFLSEGMDLLQAHPEVPRGRSITSAIVAMDVRGGDKVLLAAKDRVLAYNQLLWHWSSRGQERRAAAALREALGDKTIADQIDKLWGMSRVLNPLSVSDPRGAAELFVEIARVGQTKTDLRTTLWKLATAFSQMPPARAADGKAALRLLFAAVSAPAFPGPFAPLSPQKREINGHTVDIQNRHEFVLYSFGAFVHVVAPDLYEEFRPHLAQWDEALRSIDTHEKWLAIMRGALPPLRPAGSPTFDIMRVPLSEALSAVEKMPRGQISGYENIALRTDITPEERAAVVERARKLIRAELSANLERADIDSVGYHQTARELRWAGIELDSDTPSLKAKLALIDLEEAVQQHFDFSLPGPDGKMRKLSDERGKVVMVNFWATWCPPCRAEMPLLSKLQREWGPKGLTVMAISDETPEIVTSYERQFGYKLTVLLDPSRKVFDHYRVQGIPDTKIIDKSGRIVASFGELLSEEEVIKALRIAGLE